MKSTVNINNRNMNNKSEKLRLTKYCEWKDCNNKGIHRAPKNRENLREFRWFCLEHIREYNNKWNHFSGLSQIEIEKELKADFTWHLPTWPMNGNIKYNINDELDLLKKNSNKKIKKTKVKNNKLDNAFKKLNLTLDSSLQDIKRQYKVLVKKYHPDANNNNNKSNNKLIEINEAYKTIIDNY